ncbi:MAG: dephospho-CoA kinase [Opitutia bacterium]|jgi:dephospho-CoA kinase
MRIGLTGGIGCGKTAAAACFGRRGYQVICADRLAHAALLDPALVREIQSRWGDESLLENGLPDRDFIAERVFSEPTELRWLESRIHPRIRREWQEAIRDSAHDWVVDVPLLFEKGWQGDFDTTVAVVSKPQVQVQRLLGRGWTRAQIQARLAAQLPVEEKARRADHVLTNDGTLEQLEAQVTALVAQLRASRA